jgi:EAL domain-containing protein (putative c-di-GMP-specific phosphodiesterase class I)
LSKVLQESKALKDVQENQVLVAIEALVVSKVFREIEALKENKVLWDLRAFLEIEAQSVQEVQKDNWVRKVPRANRGLLETVVCLLLIRRIIKACRLSW